MNAVAWLKGPASCSGVLRLEMRRDVPPRCDPDPAVELAEMVKDRAYRGKARRTAGDPQMQPDRQHRGASRSRLGQQRLQRTGNVVGEIRRPHKSVRVQELDVVAVEAIGQHYEAPVRAPVGQIVVERIGIM